MKKFIYTLIFFTPFLLMSEQGGRGGGREGGGGGGGGGRAAPSYRGGQGASAGGGGGRAFSKEIQEREPVREESGPSKEEKQFEQRAAFTQPREIPQAIQKEVGPQSRVPSFNRKETEKNFGRSFNEGVESRQVPEKVESFLHNAKKLAGASKSQSVAVTHSAPPPAAAQKHLGANHPQMNNWFNQSFFANHQFYPPYYRQNQLWWNRSNWILLNGFFGWGWSDAYDYQPDGPVVVTSPSTYNSTNYYYTTVQQPAESDSTPATPAQDLTSGEEPQAEGGWLPLGVFAAGRSVTDVPYGQQFIQLAVDKEGAVSGSYYNAATDKVHPLGGKIDKETQLAAWTVTDDPSSPVMSTGIYNLTQDEVPVQVHFENGVQQSWVLLRLSKNS